LGGSLDGRREAPKLKSGHKVTFFCVAGAMH